MNSKKFTLTCLKCGGTECWMHLNNQEHTITYKCFTCGNLVTEKSFIRKEMPSKEEALRLKQMEEEKKIIMKELASPKTQVGRQIN